MMPKRQIIVGKYYDGFKKETYDINNYNKIKELPFYYDKSTIYFSLIENNKIIQTIFFKYVLPPDIFCSLIGIENPNPMAMTPTSFKLEDLPKSLQAIDIIVFDSAYNYGFELKTTNNYLETEKAFLEYIKNMLPKLNDNLDLNEQTNIFNANPFDFSKYNKQTKDSILSFLLAFEYKNQTLKHFIATYRQYIIFNELINSFDKEDISPRIK